MIESDHHQLNDDNICIIGKKNEILEREKKMIIDRIDR